MPAAEETTLFHSVNVSTNRLVNGTNVFAVEVHQASTNSSDLSFDLELIGLRPTPPPAVSIQRAGTNAVLSWSAFTDAYRLQSAASFTTGNNWSTVTNPIATTNGRHNVTVNAGGGASFFRLRGP